MILPHESGNGFARQTEDKPPLPPKDPPKEPIKVRKLVEVFVPVSPLDASDMEEAGEYAAELCADLKLEVKLGGVNLVARFL